MSAERERTKEKDTDGNNWYSLESGNYNIVQRGTDSTYIHTIISGTDTVARFSITYVPSNERRAYTRLWDGSDSTTIMPFPKEWNNDMGTPNVLLNGIMEGNAFSMQSSRERVIKNFFINHQIALSMYGKTLPVRALQFQSLSFTQIKVFTLLSSLPYAYFNYSA